MCGLPADALERQHHDDARSDHVDHGGVIFPRSADEAPGRQERYSDVERAEQYDRPERKSRRLGCRPEDARCTPQEERCEHKVHARGRIAAWSAFRAGVAREALLVGEQKREVGPRHEAPKEPQNDTPDELCAVHESP